MQPRNYFTAAAEWFLGRNPEPKLLSAEEHLIIKSSVEHWVKNGICFALPPSGITLGLEEKADIEDYGLLRLPYPVCILEYNTSDAKGELKIIVVAEMMGDQVQIDMISSASGGGIWTPPAIKCDAVVGESTYATRPRLPWYVHKKEADWVEGRNFKKDAKLMLEALALRPLYEFLHTIDRYHVVMDDIAPPERVNRKLLKNGKVPLFTYKVLTIGKPKRKSRHLGGTHASPRSHLRRGHYRTSPKGVRYWVQPCMVKGDTDGFVHKDYRVEPSELTATEEVR
jgi:hypothetical protein